MPFSPNKDATMTRLSLLLSASLLTLNASALELAKYPQAFNASNGISVIVAPSSDNTQALVQVSGINHPLDEVVILTTLKDRGNDDRDYSTTLNGSAYNMLVKRQDWGGERVKLYLPNTDGFELGFDADKSKTAKPASLLALYEQQKKQGIQEQLSRFDREQRVADFSTQLQQIDQDASKPAARRCTPKLTGRRLMTKNSNASACRASAVKSCGRWPICAKTMLTTRPKPNS